MKLVIIIGPPAVGKMTVGQALEKITNLKLFFNHMSLELVNVFFDFGTEAFERLDKTIRFAIFNEVANSDLEGLIFTLVWDYNFKEDEAYVNEIIQVFRKRNAQICLVELQADLEERLKRNKHTHRLSHKPSKRNLEFSEKSLLRFESEYRMISYEDEFEDKVIYKIDNTNLSPEQVAAMIKEKYKL
ncbi:MAG: AAA family ATPase [Saprospiraceae bacterium]|nr:AAA family ATPase [Saprospiraceae bacterium]